MTKIGYLRMILAKTTRKEVLAAEKELVSLTQAATVRVWIKYCTGTSTCTWRGLLHRVSLEMASFIGNYSQKGRKKNELL